VKKESVCLVDSCRRPFLLESIAAIGIRLPEAKTEPLSNSKPSDLKPSNSTPPSSEEQRSTFVQNEVSLVKHAGKSTDNSPRLGMFLKFVVVHGLCKILQVFISFCYS